MKRLFCSVLSLAAVAAAVVLPVDPEAHFQQASSHAFAGADANLQQQHQQQHQQQQQPSSFWNDAVAVPSSQSVDAAFGLLGEHGRAARRIRAAFDAAVHSAVQDAGRKMKMMMAPMHSGFRDAIAGAETYADIEGTLRNIGHGRDRDRGKGSDLTIYELISRSEYTTKFAKLVDKHPGVVKLLNCTDADAAFTLFAPVDEAFDDIPDDHPDFGDKIVEDALHYHIGLGKYPAGRILHTYTIPSALDEKLLGDEPQRLRPSVGLSGVRINFYSKVVAADIAASNGVIHAVNQVLIPPPHAGRLISLFPAQFSTLLLAYEKTDFVKFIHGANIIGSTIFAPSNGAFAALGARANAFLFNTNTGRKYLGALLKYQIVPNATLYHDAFYDKRESSDADDEERKASMSSREHYDLPTFLGDAHISVDIARVFGFATMKVNGFSQVFLRDGIAKNGVIQVVDRLPLPPCKHKHHNGGFSKKGIDVEVLKSILDEYVS